MEVFELRNQLIEAYREYATSFMRIRDGRIKARVDQALDEGSLWPHPQIGLNPAFESGGTVSDLVAEGLLHPDCAQIFRGGKSPADVIGKEMTLHRHQADAIRASRDDRSYVLTTGTGSGKSLSYIIPIVDHVLRTGSGQGVKAIVVYPMNALANSQMEELGKFLGHGPWGHRPPVTFARYTGQEDDEARQQIRQNPPDIILTNYVMLELVLTRYIDRKLVSKLGDLRFLVLDELHTYRGRQGADVALLVRRLREASGSTGAALCRHVGNAVDRGLAFRSPGQGRRCGIAVVRVGGATAGSDHRDAAADLPGSRHHRSRLPQPCSLSDCAARQRHRRTSTRSSPTRCRSGSSRRSV